MRRGEVRGGRRMHVPPVSAREKRIVHSPVAIADYSSPILLWLRSSRAAVCMLLLPPGPRFATVNAAIFITQRLIRS
jgi:hypothetical protein